MEFPPLVVRCHRAVRRRWELVRAAFQILSRGGVGAGLRQGPTAMTNRVPSCFLALVCLLSSRLSLSPHCASRLCSAPAFNYATQYMGTSGTETERIAAETEKRVADTYEATKSRKEEVVSMLISFVTNVDTTVRSTGK